MYANDTRLRLLNTSDCVSLHEQSTAAASARRERRDHHGSPLTIKKAIFTGIIYSISFSSDSKNVTTKTPQPLQTTHTGGGEKFTNIMTYFQICNRFAVLTTTPPVPGSGVLQNLNPLPFRAAGHYSAIRGHPWPRNPLCAD